MFLDSAHDAPCNDQSRGCEDEADAKRGLRRYPTAVVIAAELATEAPLIVEDVAGSHLPPGC